MSGEAAGQEPSSKQQWLDWTVKIQSLAQAGLHYGRDRFDLERYQELRDIAAAMMAAQADLPLAKVKDLFCNETGYQTPKIDTRAAIFQEDKILLVHESTGKWSLPGGWCDVDQSVADNTIKEVKEEAGLDVAITRVIAIDDWRRHNRCNNPYGIIKIFSLCKVLGGSFHPNIETTEAAYFSEQELPQNIALEKNSLDQIHRCFVAHRTPDLKTTMD
nr:NUDIX hydrolase [uncultured Mitsuokella sp.]